MVVATANCAHWTSTRVLAAALAMLEADVLGLQEVDRRALRTRFADQTAVVAGTAGPGHSWAWARGERIGPAGVLGLQGVGLVVRGRIADRERLELPRLAPPAGERVAPLTGRHKRVALLARVLPTDGPEATVAVVHLAVSRPEAEGQLAAVVAALARRPRPHLLLGDLNIPVGDAVLGPLVAGSVGPTFPRRAPRSSIDVVAAAGLLVAILWYIVQRTRIGKAMRAVADNRDLAASSGIDVNRVILVVWIMGGALAALGGVLLGLSDQVQWDMGFRLLLLMFAGVTLGGLGTAYGALLGSVIVGVFVQMSTLVIRDDMKYVGGLLLLIVILVIRPQGILGARARIG